MSEKIYLKELTLPITDEQTSEVEEVTYHFVQTDDELETAGDAADAKATGDALNDLKGAICLQEENIPGTTQTITFDSSGNVSQIKHCTTGTTTAVRTDAFTFAANSITEVRTLATGESLTIVTNTTTLETTVTYAAA